MAGWSPMTTTAIARLTAQCAEQDLENAALRQKVAAMAAQNDRLEREIARLTEENAALQARG